MKKINPLSPSLLIALTVILLGACNSTPDNSLSRENAAKKDTVPTGTNKNDVAITEIKTGAQLAGKLIDDVAANKKRKDSLKAVNATHTWVYQIGEAFEKDNLAAAEGDKLSSISNIYVFRKSRREYYLIKDDGYPKEQLEDSLGDFKKRLNGIETRVEIIDLGSFCSGKRKPSLSDPIKYKVDGEKKEIQCHECE